MVNSSIENAKFATMTCITFSIGIGAMHSRIEKANYYFCYKVPKIQQTC